MEEFQKKTFICYRKKHSEFPLNHSIILVIVLSYKIKHKIVLDITYETCWFFGKSRIKTL